jgi:hypothetical protein
MNQFLENKICAGTQYILLEYSQRDVRYIISLVSCLLPTKLDNTHTLLALRTQTTSTTFHCKRPEIPTMSTITTGASAPQFSTPESIQSSDGKYTRQRACTRCNAKKIKVSNAIRDFLRWQIARRDIPSSSRVC